MEVSYDGFILFFGRIEPYKGLDTLLGAYSQMVKAEANSRVRDAKLIIAGQGVLPKQWRNHLPEGVHWESGTIQDEDALNMFRRCSLVILPYDDGTQSAIIPAAYFFRKPVIATNVGALAEYVEEGETGWLVNPQDSTMLMERITEALSNPAKLIQMGEASRKWYDEQRTIEAKGLDDLYANLYSSWRLNESDLSDNGPN
jgi:glycosyltransferase involved in cell wall biosynthesis